MLLKISILHKVKFEISIINNTFVHLIIKVQTMANAFAGNATAIPLTKGKIVVVF